MIISHFILLRIRNVSDKLCGENQNTHFMFNNFCAKVMLLMRQCGRICTARQATGDSIIWHMLFDCWITKATDTHFEYVNTYCFSTATRVARTHTNVTLYVHCLSCMC